jgi:hypothetical protein
VDIARPARKYWVNHGFIQGSKGFPYMVVGDVSLTGVSSVRSKLLIEIQLGCFPFPLEACPQPLASSRLKA